jgi:hypothetical protein
MANIGNTGQRAFRFEVKQKYNRFIYKPAKHDK